MNFRYFLTLITYPDKVQLQSKIYEMFTAILQPS